MLDFNEIKQRCHGMMRPEVYQKIYERALSSHGNTFVEIGSAHGASTVCLAKALKDSGRTGKVYTFDKFSGGSRRHYGDPEENIKFLKENLKFYGVDDIVEIIAGDIKDTYINIPKGTIISLLMLDSDGKIDRDFDFFYDMLSEDCSLIIDDMADRARVTDKGTYSRIDQKHRITFLLTNSAEKAGLIEKEDHVYQTWFGKKNKNNLSNWSKEDILECYRNLVFGNAETIKKK